MLSVHVLGVAHVNSIEGLCQRIHCMWHYNKVVVRAVWRVEKCLIGVGAVEWSVITVLKVPCIARSFSLILI